MRTPDSPYRPDNPRERQGVRGRGTLHLRGFQQGRWRRAWKTDARFPCEGSERDAGGALADRVHELKETEKGVEHMCKEMLKNVKRL